MVEPDMDNETLLAHRSTKDRFFAESPGSPLPAAARTEFGGLHYYEPNPDLVFTVPVEPADGAEVTIQTSDGSQRIYRRLGTASFDVDGVPATLTIYSTGHPGLFIPFRDATSGTETYGAGRYLDLEPNDDRTVTVDFNYAYNPFCVYDEAYSCPLPPGENWLTVPIRAGERVWAPNATMDRSGDEA